MIESTTAPSRPVASHGHTPPGPPAHVIEGIKSIEAKYPGLEDFMIHWAEGLPPKEFMEQLRWFARDVMPRSVAADRRPQRWVPLPGILRSPGGPLGVGVFLLLPSYMW